MGKQRHLALSFAILLGLSQAAASYQHISKALAMADGPPQPPPTPPAATRAEEYVPPEVAQLGPEGRQYIMAYIQRQVNLAVSSFQARQAEREQQLRNEIQVLRENGSRQSHETTALGTPPRTQIPAQRTEFAGSSGRRGSMTPRRLGSVVPNSHSRQPSVAPSSQSRQATPTPTPHPSPRVSTASRLVQNVENSKLDPAKPAPNSKQASNKRKRGSDKPIVRLQFQLLRGDIDDDARPIQYALFLHVRIMWDLLESHLIPAMPTDAVVRAFNTRYANDAALYAEGGSLVNTSGITLMLENALRTNAKIASEYSKVEEHIIEYIKMYIARFGLSSWRPDFRQTAYSLYNSAHRIIALDTFKQALISGAYNAVYRNVKPTYAAQMALLVRLYDHIVHFYFFSRWKQHFRVPGSVAIKDARNIVYRRRIRLADARYKTIIDNGLPRRYAELIAPKATSDDKLDPSGAEFEGRPVYLIRSKPPRSAEATRFLRDLDRLRLKGSPFDPSDRGRERYRVQPPDSEQKEGRFRRLPKDPLPIDYFDPEWYNKQSPALRSKISAPSIVLPRNLDELFTGTGDEALSDGQLYDARAESVFTLYNYVDRLDIINNIDDGALGGDENEEDEEEPDPNDDDLFYGPDPDAGDSVAPVGSSESIEPSGEGEVARDAEMADDLFGDFELSQADILDDDEEVAAKRQRLEHHIGQ